MAVKDIILSNTAIVEEATELLKVLGDRAGRYVWKRVVTETTEVSVTNPSFSIVGDNNTGWTITEASFDHTQVTLDFFDGFTSSDGRIVFAKNSGKVQLKAVGYQGTSLTYNPSTGFFQNNTPSSDGTFTVSYTGTKTYTTETEIVDYVVADDEAAYPDGGEQDGYWYERVVEGIKGEEIFFTQSTASRTVTIPHSLGVVPTGFHIRVTTYNTSTNGVKTVVCPFSADSSARGVYKFSGNSRIHNDEFKATITNTEITIETHSDLRPFAAGDEYRMIVWA